jgi:hypothetical protein
MLPRLVTALILLFTLASGTADARKVGPEFRIDPDGPVNPSEPSVTTLADGSFVVVWSAWNGTTDNVFGQRFNAAGEQVGSVFRVDTNDGETIKSTPGVAGLKEGGFVVTWDDWYNYDRFMQGFDVYARLYTAAGEPAGEPFRPSYVSIISEPSVAAGRRSLVIATPVTEPARAGISVPTHLRPRTKWGQRLPD